MTGWRPISWVSQRNTGTTCGRHSAMLWPPALFGMYTTCTVVGAFAVRSRATVASQGGTGPGPDWKATA